MIRLRHWFLPIACVLALCAGVWVSYWDGSLPGSKSNLPSVQGFFWPDQKSLQPFELVSHRNTPFSLADLEGQWTLLFFGYTYCPDICPITMSLMREALTNYQTAAPAPLTDIRVVFISVDGKRDTPEQLANYIRFYNEKWLAASGSRGQVDSLTGQLGVPYSIEEHDPGAMNYLVSHPGTLFLISPDTQLAALFQPPLDPRQLADDLLSVRRFMAQG